MRKTIAALGALYLTFAFGTTAQAQAAINPNPIGVDPEHYQCYNVQGEPTAITIKSLADQFGKSQDLRVTGPTILCAPVSKNGELLADRVSHLVCYTIQNSKPLAPSPLVEVKNQLGTFRFKVVQSRILCVPSLKRVVPAG
jgi:hypothetical protein